MFFVDVKETTGAAGDITDSLPIGGEDGGVE